MKQLSKLWKLSKGTFNMLLVFGYVIYLYGIVGFIKASRGVNDKKVDDYITPLIWNFITLSITTIIIFKK